MRLYFVYLLFLISFYSKAQQEINNIDQLPGYETTNTIKLNYLSVNVQPGESGRAEIPMGTIGLHYDFTLNKHFYAGIGMFAAVDGDQGGLFTLGAELGFQQKIYKNLYLDTDFHFGGGGGYRYLVKDGAFINYNVGLKYKTPKISFGLQYSYFDFYKGHIKSNSLSGFISVPTKLLFTDYKYANKKFKVQQSNNPYFWNRPASKNGVALRFDHFLPIGETKDAYNIPLEQTLYLLGFEYDHYIGNKTFTYIHLDAIYKGLESGFMDLFIGAGYEAIQTKNFKVYGKFGIGTSGGRVEREGGFTIYPSIGIDQKIHKNISLQLHGGYVMAPYGNFEAYTFGGGIKYTTYDNGVSHKELNDNVTVQTKGIRLILQNQTYFDASRSDSPTDDLQLITIQINQDFSKHFYLTGQAAFTYDGGAGGYADGMVGIGYNTDPILNKKIEVNLEFLGGVSGGAGVDSGTGLTIKPKVGINYILNQKFHLIVNTGKIIAPYGTLNSTILSLGFSFNLAKIQVKSNNN